MCKGILEFFIIIFIILSVFFFKPGIHFSFSEAFCQEGGSVLGGVSGDEVVHVEAVGVGVVLEARSGESGVVISEPRQRRSRIIRNREFDDREKVILLLNAHCNFPTRLDLLTTSVDAEAHIRSVIEDETQLSSVRMRALEALSFFSSEENIETLREILGTPDRVESNLMLIYAIRAFMRVSGGQGAFEIEAFLSHENDFIRWVSIESLRRCPDEACLTILRRRRDVEENRFFQLKLEQAISGHCRALAYCEDWTYFDVFGDVSVFVAWGLALIG